MLEEVFYKRDFIQAAVESIPVDEVYGAAMEKLRNSGVRSSDSISFGVRRWTVDENIPARHIIRAIRDIRGSLSDKTV